MLLYLYCENEDNLNMPSFLFPMLKLNHLILIDVKYESALNFFFKLQHSVFASLSVAAFSFMRNVRVES